jgi:plastocyanin
MQTITYKYTQNHHRFLQIITLPSIDLIHLVASSIDLSSALLIDPKAIMAAANRSALLVVAMAAAVLATTATGATTYTVGAPAGSWDTRTNYAQWVSAVTFRVGDQLVFKYSPAAHDVVEVTKAGYDSCSSSGPIATFNSGDDTVPLAAIGTRYFICGFPGHCAAGMKLAVKVEAAAAAPGGSSTTPSPSPSPAALPPVNGGQPVTPSSSASKSGGVVESLVGLGVGAMAAGLMVFY